MLCESIVKEITGYMASPTEPLKVTDHIFATLKYFEVYNELYKASLLLGDKEGASGMEHLHKRTHGAEFAAFKETALYKYLKGEEHCVIAGGYATQMWIDRAPKASSDIDVFVFTKDAAERLLDHFCVREVEVHKQYLRAKKFGVFQFSVADLPHKVQVICDLGSTPGWVLQNFDFSYCRCMIYMGELLATPCASKSLETKTAVVYSNHVRLCRVHKALSYVDRIVNLGDIPMESCVCQRHVSGSTWVSINRESIRGNIGVVGFQNYTRETWGLHDFLKRIPISKDYDVFGRRLEPVSYLECCTGDVTVKYVFTLKYDRPELPFIARNRFYTGDLRYKSVYEFWTSCKPMIVRANAERYALKSRSRCMEMRSWASDLFGLLNPPGTSERPTYFIVCGTAPTPGHGWILPKFKDGREYKLSISFRRCSISVTPASDSSSESDTEDDW